MLEQLAKPNKYLVYATYIGKHFNGFQSQRKVTSFQQYKDFQMEHESVDGQMKKPKITVQDKIEMCLSEAFNTCIKIAGCSRTDKSVNALEYCFHFTLQKEKQEQLTSILYSHKQLLKYLNHHNKHPSLHFN